MINKYQVGGAAPQDLQAQIQQAIMQISQATGEQPETIVAALKNGKLNFKKVLEALQQGNVQAAKQMIQQLAGTPMARLGTKLNYIRTLKGACPEGQEVKYFKEGGKTKCKCVDKAAGGEKAKDGKKTIADFKKKKACGGMKAKKQEGGELDEPDGKYNNRMFRMVQRGVMNPQIAAMSAKDGVKTQKPLKPKKSDKKPINKPIINRDDTVHVKGKPFSITYSDGTKKNPKSPYPNYSNKMYLDDWGSRSDKEAQRRVKKVDRVTNDENMKCGGKAKKHQFGGSLNGIPFLTLLGTR